MVMIPWEPDIKNSYWNFWYFWVILVTKKSEMVILSHFWNPAIIALTPLPTAATKIEFETGDKIQLGKSYHNPGHVY